MDCDYYCRGPDGKKFTHVSCPTCREISILEYWVNNQDFICELLETKELDDSKKYERIMGILLSFLKKEFDCTQISGYDLLTFCPTCFTVCTRGFHEDAWFFHRSAVREFSGYVPDETVADKIKYADMKTTDSLPNESVEKIIKMYFKKYGNEYYLVQAKKIIALNPCDSS